MKNFIHDDFMLTNEPARRLYHDYAKDMPIIDYHCHLPPQEIAENQSFGNLSKMWLAGDHYKWRALRTMGVEEKYITGNASDKEKFMQWAKVVPYTIGNPLYHWTHLELKRYFDIDTLLSEESAEEIWEQTREKIASPEFTPQQLITKSGVEMIGTTDDPIDSLEYHQMIKEDDHFHTQVLPTFRPDPVIDIMKASFPDYRKKLEQAAGTGISDYASLLRAVEDRAEYFHANGCRLSDHGLTTLPFRPATFEEAAAVFKKVLGGAHVSREDLEKYQTYTLVFLGRLYAAKGWVMQLHIGALRDNNQRMFKEAGANSGFDSINDFHLASSLNGFLNELDRGKELPKTIIYNLNPLQNDVIATAIGNFQAPGVKGKVQFGSGWWFNDQKEGMERQLKDLGKIGLLSSFVGMLTDSRSILSYTRHEYFRRILANLIGGWIENGEVPDDDKLVGTIMQDICYHNARNYLSLHEN